MKLSARNLLKGKILEVKRGQTKAHVKPDAGCEIVITSSITVEAVDELNLKRARGDPENVRRHEGVAGVVIGTLLGSSVGHKRLMEPIFTSLHRDSYHY